MPRTPHPKPMPSLDQAMARLRALGDPGRVPGRARYALPEDNCLGVSMPHLRALARELGRHHALALELWETGVRDARLLACLVDEPGKVDGEQMERWALDFDNWAECDTACMNLFDAAPLAREKIRAWAERPEEFVKRAAFATLAAPAVHNKKAPDADFLGFLPLIERGARDQRNFVKKAVNWALRQMGKRNPVLHKAALALASDLAASDSAPARWVGRDALRELDSEKVRARLGLP